MKDRLRAPGLAITLGFLAVGLITLAGVSAIAAYQWRYADRVYPGVTVAALDLTGRTFPQTLDALAERWPVFPTEQPISLHWGEHTWPLSAADLGATVDAVATAGEAFRYGREHQGQIGIWAGLTHDVRDQWAALQHGVTLTPTLRYDERQLRASVQAIAALLDRPMREGAITIAGWHAHGTPGEIGRRVDVDATVQALAAVVRSGRGGQITLVVAEERPQVLSVDAAVAQANALLGRTFVLAAPGAYETQQFAIEPGMLSRWLTLAPVQTHGTAELSVTVQRDQVAAFVTHLAQQIDRPAVDATLDFDAARNQVVVLQPSHIGQRLAISDTIGALETALLRVRDGTPDASDGATLITHTLTLPVSLLPPRIDSERVAEMGIVELVSEGTSSFAGSSRERVRNILNAAGKFHSVVAPPGEEFSFYGVIGDVSAANGFVDALVIVGDRTETGVGGGVCQVSTTVFRAAYQGGFPIVERYAHGYVVGWYGEPGLDASIFTPAADFRFLNDTGHHILIKPNVDTKHGRISFSIYGTKPDREVESSGPIVTNTRPAPKPLYQEDATLPAGTIKQVDWAKEGMDVTVKRTIRYGDGRTKVDAIVSKYRPWQAVFLYGPGTPLPAEATQP